ncbi:MAG: cytochrome P450 [Frankiaceae bacterium]|nr:cytochrome P450 [Frankiaceae bacterium]MBV9872209.1 cytochrome P450 [Frankiaceae bacterium]
MKPATSEPFSLARRNPPGLRQNLSRFAFAVVLPALMRLLCRLSPVCRIPGTNLVIITGFDSTQEVYSRHVDFEVPYEERVKILRWQGFVLALQDTPEYHDMYDNISRLWQPADTTRVQEIARRTAETILAETWEELDFIQDLVKPVLMAIVEQHYGVTVPDEQLQPFFDGNLAGSGFLFSGPWITKKQRETGAAAIDGVWPVLDAAMAAACANPDPTTVLGRYYSGGPDPAFSEAKLRSALMTMIGGYLPTCANASGRIMDVLLSRKDAMQFMQEAVHAKQDDSVLTGLMEALRVNYIIPFLWRRAAQDTYLGEGTTRRRTVRKGKILAVSLPTAMYDRRRIEHPKRFDPGRSPAVRMVYGHQFHHCIGASIANTVLVEMFKAVLTRQPAPARKAKNRKNRWVGAYPWNLWLALSKASAAP